MGFIDFMKGVWHTLFPLKDIKSALGIKPAIGDEMLNAIELWSDCYTGLPPKNGVHSLGLERSVTREFANIVLGEMSVNISDPQLAEVFDCACEDLNAELQMGLATGAMVIKPLGADSVQYVAASAFVPIEFDAYRRLTKVIFPEFKKIGDRYFTRLEFHSLDPQKGLTISNTAYVSASSNNLGTEIELKAVDEWADLPPSVTYPDMRRPAFGYFRTPIKNTIDNSPCGVSIFANALELIRMADVQFSRLDWEFESGERAIHIAPEAVKSGHSDKLNRRLYKVLDLDVDDGKGFFKDFSPALRQADITDGLETYLRQIEFAVGLAYGDLSNPNAVAKTATEIRSAKDRKYNTVSAIQRQLRYCLDDLVYALAFYNAKAASGYTFVCNFKDSILTDEEAERKQDIQDLNLGIMQPAEYRAKWYSEDLQTAAANLPQSAEVLE